jgi:hypothetical protein
MKAIRFSRRSNSKHYHYVLDVDMNLVSETIQKAIVYTYIGLSSLCGLASGLSIWYCVDKMSIDFSRFMFIIITGFIFFFFVYLMNREKIKTFMKSIRKKEMINLEEIFSSK